jgi:hypothetical protein
MASHNTEPTANRLSEHLDSCQSIQRSELPTPLAYLSKRCSRTDVPLDEWLGALTSSDMDTCLRCQTPGGELFLAWNTRDEKIYELTRTDSGVVLSPQQAGVVRATAAIDSADAVMIVPTNDTPFAWVSGYQ